MMGTKGGDQHRLFYSFNLDKHVPADHLLRRIDHFLDLSELRRHLEPFYSHMIVKLLRAPAAAIALLCVADMSAAGLASQVATASNGASRMDTTNWNTYRNSEYGFEVRYPKDWRLAGEGSGTQGPTGQPAQQTRVWMITVRKPHRDGEPDAQLLLGVQEKANPKRLSIDEYAAEQLKLTKETPQASGHLMLGSNVAVYYDVTSTSGKRVRATYTVLHGTDLVSLIYQPQEPFESILAAIVASFRIVK
jgi:hypothetical protein